ncbi:unnamed protein product [Pleuronectes platessa]|uniref:Uncharacterized protein n=1 Tax=Pleuronectes platessa TaxID=8262 RepID=A0A9N7YE17_PLEPL|nr:unnamed protein product [Pleuronectes platessa]
MQRPSSVCLSGSGQTTDKQPGEKRASRNNGANHMVNYTEPGSTTVAPAPITPPVHKLIKYQINAHQFPPAPAPPLIIIISDLSGWLAGTRPIHQLHHTADGPAESHFLHPVQLDCVKAATSAGIVEPGCKPAEPSTPQHNRGPISLTTASARQYDLFNKEPVNQCLIDNYLEPANVKRSVPAVMKKTRGAFRLRYRPSKRESWE